MEDMTSEQWLIKVGGKRVFDKFWQPMFQNKFREAASKVSGVDIWARLNRLWGDKETKRQNHMCYLRGKLRKLFDVYESYLMSKGVVIQTNKSVQVIEPEKALVKLEVNGQQEKFEKVYITLPAPYFAGLIPSRYEDYKRRIASIPYLGNICFIMALKEKLFPYYMMAINDANIPFTGIIGISNLYDLKEMNGHHVYYVSYYFYKDLTCLKMSDEEVYVYFTGFLEKMFSGIRQKIQAYLVTRVRYTEPIYYPGFKPPEFNTPMPNVHFISGSQIYPRTPVINSNLALADRLLKTL